MKKRDFVLFAVPFAAAVFTAAFAFFLFRQTIAFENTYTDEAEDYIAQYVRLAASVAAPLLRSGKDAEAVQFCEARSDSPFRLTLIDPSGRVVADSSENRVNLGNHSDRLEVSRAMNGRESGAVRYSASLGRGMVYYAVPLETPSGRYVLRAALSTEKVGRITDFARLNVALAMFLGAFAVTLFAMYIVKRVRRPIIELQESVKAIADGDLSQTIETPRGGIVRELASGVSEMAEQLKKRLAEVTSERNERAILFDTMSEGVLLFARDGSLVRANKAACMLFDIPSSDGSSKYNIARCGMPDLLELAYALFRGGRGFEREFESFSDSRPKFLFVRGRLIDEDGKERLLLTVNDLTGLRRLESFRSDFVADVSHEIKTPLTCIVGAAEAMEDESVTPELRTRLLEILIRQSKRLNGLVRDILSLASLEKGEYGIKRDFTSLSLDSVLVNAANSCASSASGAGINLTVEKNEPLTAEGDPALLEQAVSNLVDNAVKYSCGKNIRLSLVKSGDSAVFEVRDDGVGIAECHVQRIFERFYRIDKSRSRELGGTGLGLAIVKHTAQLHGGRAELESKPGSGCVFKIIIPLSEKDS